MIRPYQFSLRGLLVWVTLICGALGAIVAFVRTIEIGYAAARKYDYNQIAVGMDLARVEKQLGRPGSRIALEDVPQTRTGYVVKGDTYWRSPISIATGVSRLLEENLAWGAVSEAGAGTIV